MPQFTHTRTDASEDFLLSLKLIFVFLLKIFYISIKKKNDNNFFLSKNHWKKSVNYCGVSTKTSHRHTRQSVKTCYENTYFFAFTHFNLSDIVT